MMGADDVDEEIEVVVDGVVEMSMLSGWGGKTESWGGADICSRTALASDCKLACFVVCNVAVPFTRQREAGKIVVKLQAGGQSHTSFDVNVHLQEHQNQNAGRRNSENRWQA